MKTQAIAFNPSTLESFFVENDDFKGRNKSKYIVFRVGDKVTFQDFPHLNNGKERTLKGVITALGWTTNYVQPVCGIKVKNAKFGTALPYNYELQPVALKKVDEIYETKNVRIGQPGERILVKANIVLCKHPDKQASDYAKYKEGHIYTFNLTNGKGGEKDWNESYGNYDNLPVIQSGDLIAIGREDKAGGECVNKLIDINAKWKGGGNNVYEHTAFFRRVDLLKPLPKTCIIEDDISKQHRQ